MCMYMLHIFTIHVRPYTCIRMRRKLQWHEWYREVQIYHGLRMLMERMEEKLLQGDSRWFLRFTWCSTSTDIVFVLLSLWMVEFGISLAVLLFMYVFQVESFCTRKNAAYDLCYEAFHGFVSSYRIKKSYPKVNSSSPRGQLATLIQKREQLRVMMVS